MHLTLVHPCIGRRVGEPYIQAWEMEPLPPATLAGLTPDAVEVDFYDDRMEPIPYDAPTDLVALSVETYTAKRAYQIASEYRRRGVPVVMGGFHATLVPEEVSRYCEALVMGEAEGLWQRVLEDADRGQLQRVYRQEGRPSLGRIRPDRSIFEGKTYLPIGLIEAGRGCHFQCDFCAIQAYFNSTQTRRPIDDIVAEIEAMDKNLYFFVDDNITSRMNEAKALFRRLADLDIRWVSQASINAAHDEEFLELLEASGCQGVLVGFETLDPDNLEQMNKQFNTMRGGYEEALANFRAHDIRLYGTFILGYDKDTRQTIEEAVAFAKKHRLYMAAFNHLTPFPGTPLYDRLEDEGRLRYDKWWLDDDYRYNMVPFEPKNMTPREVQRACVDARADFYSVPSIARRSLDPVNRGSLFDADDRFMWRNFFFINGMLRREVEQRDFFPLGDERYDGDLLEARHTEPFDPSPTPVDA